MSVIGMREAGSWKRHRWARWMFPARTVRQQVGELLLDVAYLPAAQTGSCDPEIELRMPGSVTGEIASLRYQACERCLAGWIVSIATDDAYQRRGLATGMLALLRERHQGFRWVTAAQFSHASPFWSSVKERWPGDYLAEGQRCPHMPQLTSGALRLRA